MERKADARATVAKTLALIYLVIFLPLTLSITQASTTPRQSKVATSVRQSQKRHDPWTSKMDAEVTYRLGLRIIIE